MEAVHYKKAISKENFIFTIIFFSLFGLNAWKMGLQNMLSTIMATAFDLLINTCLYIMAISVITAALSSLFSEFGFIALIDQLLSKIIQPLYDMPGAASLGIMNCYMSDNPAILTLANDNNFKQYFKKISITGVNQYWNSLWYGAYRFGDLTCCAD